MVVCSPRRSRGRNVTSIASEIRSARVVISKTEKDSCAQMRKCVPRTRHGGTLGVQSGMSAPRRDAPAPYLTCDNAPGHASAWQGCDTRRWPPRLLSSNVGRSLPSHLLPPRLPPRLRRRCDVDFAACFWEPPIRVELMTYGLRNPRCTQCFQEVRVPSDQSCPFERIAELIKELEKLIGRCPTCSKCPTDR